MTALRLCKKSMGSVPVLALNTLRPRQDGRHFADDSFTCIFFNENCCILIKFSLKYVRKGPIDNNRTLVQIMAWRRSGDKPLSEPMMIILPTHICVTRPQWVNSLWPSDTIWQHRSGLILAQVMACYLMAPSHYLNISWFFINEILWHSAKSSFTLSAPATNLYYEFESYTFRINPTCPRANDWTILMLRIEGTPADALVPAVTRPSEALVLTPPPAQNGRHFGRGEFQIHFLELKWLKSDANFTEICSQEFNLQ